MGLSSMPSAGDAFLPVLLLANIILPFAFLKDGALWLLLRLLGQDADQSIIHGGDHRRRQGISVTRFRARSTVTKSAGEGLYCSVCLHGYEDGEDTSEVLRCRHLFHRSCLDRWALEHHRNTCPLCRSPLN